MKRSDMVHIISEFLDDFICQDKAYAWKYSKKSADSLLRQIEEEGMLPPELIIEEQGPCYPVKVRYINKFEWEPEDD